MNIYREAGHLAVLAHECERGFDEPLKHFVDERHVLLGQHFRQGVRPGQRQGAPAERSWLQVDHAAPAHRRRLHAQQREKTTPFIAPQLTT